MRLREAEARRLRTQSEQIIYRLRRGPATNRELSGIALKYTGRISDLRKLGYQITCKRVGFNGLTEYDLT